MPPQTIRVLAVNWLRVSINDFTAEFAFTPTTFLLIDPTNLAPANSSAVSVKSKAVVTLISNSLMLIQGFIKVPEGWICNTNDPAWKAALDAIAKILDVATALSALPPGAKVDIATLSATADIYPPKLTNSIQKFNASRINLSLSAKPAWTVKLAMDGAELSGIQKIFADALNRGEISETHLGQVSKFNHVLSGIVSRLVDICRIPPEILQNINLSTEVIFNPTSAVVLEWVLYDTDFLFNVNLSAKLLEFMVLKRLTLVSLQ
jgi:hypothetical protein